MQLFKIKSRCVFNKAVWVATGLTIFFAFAAVSNYNLRRENYDYNDYSVVKRNNDGDNDHSVVVSDYFSVRQVSGVSLWVSIVID